MPILMVSSNTSRVLTLKIRKALKPVSNEQCQPQKGRFQQEGGVNDEMITSERVETEGVMENKELTKTSQAFQRRGWWSQEVCPSSKSPFLVVEQLDNSRNVIEIGD